MANTYTQIHIQAVFAVKTRLGLINAAWKDNLYKYMTGIVQANKHKMLAINGMPDHVHSLFLLNPNKAVADVIKQVKGSCSHEINKQNIIKEKFAWQTGYAAYSVSESVLDKVFQYIKNQKQHHIKINFQNEYDDFIRLHALQNEVGNG